MDIGKKDPDQIGLQKEIDTQHIYTTMLTNDNNTILFAK